MSESIVTIERILKSEYSTDGFVALIKEIFDSVRIVAPNKKNKEYSNFNSHIESYSHIGSYTSPDDKKIAVFEVQLKAANYVENSRSTQRSYARKLIDNGNVDAAIIAFFTPGDSKWRLSFVRLDYEMKFEGGKFKAQENLTPAKRYSFLVGKDEPCHTAISRFHNFIIDKNYNPTLNEIEEAFSVEKVTKEFFDLYCEKFYQLQEYLESNRDFMEESERCGFTSEQFAKKLMGQIVFLYFLQKKGWLGVNVWLSEMTEKEYKNVYFTPGAQGRIIKEQLPKIYVLKEDGLYHLNSRVLDEILDEDEEIVANHMPRIKTWGDGSKLFLRTIYDYSQTHKKHFYEKYLEPLFYDALNRNRGAMGYFPALHCRVPFLSGGLFDPIDNYDWKNTNFDIPDELFSNKKSDNDRDADGILDIFDRYNFTMSEDEPMEREVAIDPEMLGKVFENLLEVKDRKSKGEFYTPRPIVHYMCQESLIYYLVRKTGLKETDIRDFIIYGDFMKDEDTTKEKREGNGGMYISEEIFKIDNEGRIVVNRLSEIDMALSDVKIADPAVGSGAFPLGMMNEIVRARQNITAYMSIGMNTYNKRMLYRNERSPYVLKYNTIKNCLYAVDIEPSAVDIAQLRLWLSLVIEDEINPKAQNDLEGHRDPLPLPNLECNILCGNSLIDEFNGVKLVRETDILGAKEEYQIALVQDDFEIILKKLLEEQNLLFSCDDPVKKQKHKETIQSYKDMIVSQEVINNPAFMEEYSKAIAMSSKPFIVWQLDFARVFRDNGGFDIVIGNPPYIKESDYKEVYDIVKQTSFGKKYAEGKMNYWYFFFHKGMDLLCENGHLSYIAPNYFVAGSGATKLNKRLVNECNIKLYVDFNKTKVFETANVQCMILVVENCLENTPTPFPAYMFMHRVERDRLPFVMSHLNTAKDAVEKYEVLDQKTIMSIDYKINFENAKFASLLGKIESVAGGTQLFKSTQGIVENPSFLNNKNISSVEKAGYDISDYSSGQAVFVIPKEEIGELHLSDSEFRLLREYHEPNEVNRYYCNNSFKNYLLYLTKETLPNIEDCPNIKAHLIKFKPFMDLRRETQNGSVKWYQLHWPRKESLFLGEKIVYPQMGAVPIFAYSCTPFFTNMSANIVYAKTRIDLKVLTCILNSELAHFWLLHRAKNRGAGLDIAVSVIDKFPINEVLLQDTTLKELSQRVIQVATDGLDYSELDEAINKRVYELYDINESESITIHNYIEERVIKG